ncbi:hypothetical protein ACTOV4_10190 [Brucella sp. C7-11G]
MMNDVRSLNTIRNNIIFHLTYIRDEVEHKQSCGFKKDEAAGYLPQIREAMNSLRYEEFDDFNFELGTRLMRDCEVIFDLENPYNDFADSMVEDYQYHRPEYLSDNQDDEPEPSSPAPTL